VKNRLLTVAGGLALLAVLGKFYAEPLFAQVRAALVSSIDEPARAPYQVTFNGSCFRPCFLEAQPVPPNKRLHVTHLFVEGFSPLFDLFPFAVTVSHNSVHLAGFVATFDPQTSAYVINQDVDFYLEPGERLRTEFQITHDLTTLFHTVTGYVVDCTAVACAPIVTQ